MRYFPFEDAVASTVVVSTMPLFLPADAEEISREIFSIIKAVRFNMFCQLLALFGN